MKLQSARILATAASLLLALTPSGGFAQETASGTTAQGAAQQGLSTSEVDALVGKVRQDGDLTALVALQDAADQGNEQAMVKLGEIYASGQGIDLDGPKAVAYLEQAMTAGNTGVAVKLGEIYRDGKIVPADPQKALQLFETAAAAGNTTAQIRLANGLVQGTLGTPDVARGIGILEDLADEGNAGALGILGNLYADGGPVDVDGPKAVAYLEQAMTAGNTGVAVKLGEIYRDGKIVPADPQKARSYLEKAREAGNTSATLELAQALLEGAFGQTDSEQAMALLQGLSDSGNMQATMALGRLYSSGGPVPTDGAKAVANYERALSEGNAYAALSLGEIYRDGKIVPADGAKAVGYLTQAMEQGVTSARRILGEAMVYRKLGEQSNPATGVALLKEAMAQGDPKAPVSLASLYFWGSAVPQDVNKAISLLRDASKNGNVSAVRALVSAYRDGRGKDLPKSQSRARKALAEYGAALDPASREQEEVLLDAAFGSGVRVYARVAAYVQSLPPERRPGVLMALRGSNPNAYVYILQTRLADIGLYKGKINGLATSSTVQAISVFCSRNEIASECAYGPLSGRAANAISRKLW